MSEKGTKNKSSSVNPSRKRPPWDERFWLGEKPIDESYFERIKKPIKIEKESRNRNILKNTGQEVVVDKNKYLDKSAELKQQPPITITLETLNELKLRIEEQWELYNIPHYFRETFRKSVFSLSRHKAVAIISRELEELKRKKSYVQAAIDAVKGREEGISNIKEMLEYFSKTPDWEKSEELCAEVLEILNAYRILTLNAVESIIKWKEQLVYAMILNKSDSIGRHKTLQFMWEDQNYIIKMRNDLNFLFNSAFMRILNFSEFPDPLLLIPSKPLEKKLAKTNEYIKYLHIPNMLSKRVKLADRYILDEDREESLPPPPEQPKVSKRIDEKAAKKILEDIVELHCKNTLKGFVGKIYENEKKIAQAALVKRVKSDFLNEFVIKSVKEIASQVYQETAEGPLKRHMEGVFGKYVDEEIEKVLKLIIKEEMQNAKESSKNEGKMKKEKEIMEKKRKEEEALLKVQMEKEEHERRMQEEREEQEKKIQMEKEQKEREQKEREQKEREQKEREQKEREQMEREQKEKEQKEREQKEREENERRLQMEREENEKRLQMERERMQKEKEEIERRIQQEKEEQEKMSQKEREEFEAKRKAEEALKKQKEAEDEQLAKIILDSILNEIHIDLHIIISASYKEEVDLKNSQSSKAKSLVNSQLTENICRILIEEQINSLNIKELAESLINEAFEEKKKKTQSEIEKKQLADRERSIQNDKISEIIYLDLLEVLLSRMKFDKISEKMKEKVDIFRSTLNINTLIIKNLTADPDDYAVDEFTPGEHSPQQYEISELGEDRRESPEFAGTISPHHFETVAYEFASGSEFVDLSDIDWIPLKVHEKHIEDVFAEYYSYLPQSVLCICPPIQQLLLETYKGIDPCWYWGVKDNKIIGALVYSLDFLSANRKLTVHHLASIDYALLEQFISAASDFLFKIDSCEEIRVNLFIPIGKELPRDIKKIFTSLKFKWKASADGGVDGCDLNVMGKVRTEPVDPSARSGEISVLSLKTGCVVEPCDENGLVNTGVNEEMIQVGNRQCQVNSLLNLFGKLNKSGIQLTSDLQTRLQGEISDILEIINSTDSFNFPHIVSLVSEDPKQTSDFLAQNSLADVSTSKKSSISILALSLNFISCTYIPIPSKSATHMFLRFKSHDILVGSEFNIYSIPTSLPHIRALFLNYDTLKEELMAEMRRDKTDLFYKVESMLKSVTYTSGEVKEFSVPAFKKNVSWNVSWMQGYEILPQRDENESQFVKRCFETVNVDIVTPKPAAGILNLDKSRGFVFNSNFVFCLTHTGLDRVLDMPLFVCLVEPSDWIVS